MGFEKNTNRGSWEVGVSNYWGNILFQRCLKSDAFREKLDQVILSFVPAHKREVAQLKAEIKTLKSKIDALEGTSEAEQNSQK